MVGNSASALGAQQVFKSTLSVSINDDYSIGVDTDRHQSVFEHVLSKVDFSIDTGICMLPSNLNLKQERRHDITTKAQAALLHQKHRLPLNCI